MKINKKQKIFLAMLGLLLGSSLTLAAFTEPTAPPDSYNGGVPINLSKTDQIRTGKLAMGNGTSLPNADISKLNSFYLENMLGIESMNVRQNLVLQQNANIGQAVGGIGGGGRFIISGALRLGQLVIGAPLSGEYANPTSRSNPAYSSSGESLYIAPDATTNLGLGYVCKVTNKECPPGTMLKQYNASAKYSWCVFINPNANPSKRQDSLCTNSYPSLNITRTSVGTGVDACKSSTEVTYTSSFGANTYWQKKIGTGQWENAGAGSTTKISVPVYTPGNSSTKYGELRATVAQNGLATTVDIDVMTLVQGQGCQGQQGGGTSGGGTSQ